MPDDPKEQRPDPIEDVRKGLGLLFRAAKRTIDKIPTKDFEQAVLIGAREVGRAIENVTQTIDKQVFRRDAPPEDRPHADAPKPEAKSGDTPGPAAKTDGDPPKGPRVG